MRNLNSIMANIVRRIEECVSCERRVPAHLQKQAEAVMLYQSDPERALALLADGMQDEIEFMEDSL